MFLFCIKSSSQFGMGHLFRCIQLYNKLKSKEEDSVIVLLGEDKPTLAWLEKYKIPHIAIKDHQRDSNNWESDIIDRYAPICWINDRLNTDYQHVKKIKNSGVRLVTFDDLGDGVGEVDVNIFALANVRGEKPSGKKVLTGTEYLILPDRIFSLRYLRKDSSRWIVTLGGSDSYGATLTIVKALKQKKIKATVISGPGFRFERELRSLASDYTIIKKHVPSLVDEFALHDVAVTGGGMTAFEAAASGIPTFTVANEEWEIKHCEYLDSIGCSRFIGKHNDIDSSKIRRSINVEKMSSTALEHFPKSGTEKICNELIGLST